MVGEFGEQLGKQNGETSVRKKFNIGGQVLMMEL